VKKWRLHNVAYVVNALAITFLFVDLIRSVFGENDFPSDEIIFLGFALLIYGIFILSDYQGLKLFLRYKNKDPLNFSEKVKASILLVLLFLLEIPTGYLAWESIGLLYTSLIKNHSFIFGQHEFNWIFVILIFFSSLILLITSNLLLKALTVIKVKTKEEIENIGMES
jgi:hypothetical protein